MEAVHNKSDFRILDRELYAYIAILRQLAAKYDNTELRAQIQILSDFYTEVSDPAFNLNDQSLLSRKLTELRVCVLNLHILTVNCSLPDIQPVCLYMGDLVCQAQEAIGVAGDGEYALAV